MKGLLPELVHVTSNILLTDVTQIRILYYYLFAQTSTCMASVLVSCEHTSTTDCKLSFSTLYQLITSQKTFDGEIT